MMTALGTLPFLATLWLLVVLGARVLEESGAKIAAALKGQPPRRPTARGHTIRIRMQPAASAVSPASPRRHAAA